MLLALIIPFSTRGSGRKEAGGVSWWPQRGTLLLSGKKLVLQNYKLIPSSRSPSLSHLLALVFCLAGAFASWPLSTARVSGDTLAELEGVGQPGFLCQPRPRFP